MNYLVSFFKVLNHPHNKNAKFQTLGRLLLWKFNQLFLHIPVIVNLTNEMKCICHPDSSFGGLIVYTRFPDYAEMSFLYDILKMDSVFIDIGANIGAYSLVAASKIRSGQIYALEPTPIALKYLYENIALNNLSCIKVIEKVVSDKTGKELFLQGKHSEIDRIIYAEENKVDAVGFPAVAMDDFIRDELIRHIDIVKIDVEGAELKVLKGMKKNLLTGKVALVLFEINKNCELYGSPLDQTLALFEECGYKVYYFNHNNKLVKLTKSNLTDYRTFNALAVLQSPNIRRRIKNYLF